MTATHKVTDFGVGPTDEDLGHPVDGTEQECRGYADELNANYPNLRTDGSLRFRVVPLEATNQ